MLREQNPRCSVVKCENSPRDILGPLCDETSGSIFAGHGFGSHCGVRRVAPASRGGSRWGSRKATFPSPAAACLVRHMQRADR